MPAALLSIRTDSAIKKEAQVLFSELGLDMTTAVNMFLRQAIRVQGIPFIISRDIPTAETLSALQEVEEMKRHPERYKKYDSFSDILSEVKNDV